MTSPRSSLLAGVSVCACALLFAACRAGNLVVDPDMRKSYITHATVWWPEEEASIKSKDLLNGPPNPYGLKNFQTVDCDFVEPDVEDPLGGTTPKFKCTYEYKSGKTVDLKIKYDQQYNSALEWKNPNHEVYASLVSQRVLWALGFGGDQSVPVNVNCRNCPIEPWTYIQQIQGYDSEDMLSGWINKKLIDSGEWNTSLPMVSFASTIAYIKMDKYHEGDDITWIDAADNDTAHEGFAWPELYEYPFNNSTDATQSVARDALSVIAAFLSHCDNFDGNQGFICLDSDEAHRAASKSECKGQPFLYIHDIGGSLGYGWKLRHLDFWPNYFDLAQWSEAEVWGNLRDCEVQVNGIPGATWIGNMKVSEDGRAMAARLLSQLTTQQITDLFTAARAKLMRGESVTDWASGFAQKMQREVIGKQCGL